jgi:hypothetical protein
MTRLERQRGTLAPHRRFEARHQLGRYMTDDRLLIHAHAKRAADAGNGITDGEIDRDIAPMRWIQPASIDRHNESVSLARGAHDRVAPATLDDIPAMHSPPNF